MYANAHEFACPFAHLEIRVFSVTPAIIIREDDNGELRYEGWRKFLRCYSYFVSYLRSNCSACGHQSLIFECSSKYLITFLALLAFPSMTTGSFDELNSLPFCRRSGAFGPIGVSTAVSGSLPLPSTMMVQLVGSSSACAEEREE